MKFSCEKCGRSYVADESVRGRAFKMKCKQCGDLIVVKPASSAIAAPSASGTEALSLDALDVPRPQPRSPHPPLELESFPLPAVDPFSIPAGDPFATPASDPFLTASRGAAPASGKSTSEPRSAEESPPGDDPFARAAAAEGGGADAIRSPELQLSEADAMFADLAEEMRESRSRTSGDSGDGSSLLPPPVPELVFNEVTASRPIASAAMASPVTPPVAMPSHGKASERKELEAVAFERTAAEPTTSEATGLEVTRPGIPLPEVTAPAVETPPRAPPALAKVAAPAHSAAKGSRAGLALGVAAALVVVAGGAAWFALRPAEGPPAPATDRQAVTQRGQERPPAAAPAAPAPAPPRPSAVASAPARQVPESSPSSVAEKPVAAKPAAAKPVAAKPVAEKPVAAKPVAEKPAAARPVAAKAVEKPAPPAPEPLPMPEARVAQVQVQQPSRRVAEPPPPPAVHTAPSAPPLTSNSDLPPLDDAMIEATVAKYQRGFEGCVAAARQNEPQLALDGRKVVVTMTVNPSGKALYPTLDDVELSGSEFGKCVKRESARMVFPEFGGEPIRARVPLTFKW